jgi:hypothetical protein
MALEMDATVLDSTAQKPSDAGGSVQALRELMAANRLEPSRDREILIRDLRITQSLYGPRTPHTFDTAPVTLTYEQEMPACALPEITPEILRAALADRGCLYVPNALDKATVETLRDAIETAQNACRIENPDSLWYSTPKLPTRRQSFDLDSARKFAHSSGGCLATDSPRAMFLVCDMFERSGVRALAQNYLGEAPVLSASKFMLWRVSAGPEAGWHQDGRFLGEGMDIASVNVWTALTDCGESAPGMELVLDYPNHYIMAADDSAFDWSVSNAQVDEIRKRVPVVTPRFKAGDMLMFDQWLLHRTHRLPDMPDTRYAIESWFFAPSVFPLGRTALTV